MQRWSKLVRSFLDQPSGRRKLLIEACLELIRARLILRALPFRWVIKLLVGTTTDVVIDPLERQRRRGDIRWAVECAARHLPGETSCFPRGIAAHAMCRRRRINATLYYGAASLPDRGLSAHVWVMDDTEGVVGHQIAGEYRILGRFPG